ncbi:hypothetical protein D9753_09525 [Streptomyces dangxiongensis]|uniref:WXG100 family type VII secretion target n=1 Tax=Streptomyces dangxiongensis TaxID=1442032 RepID=A0A3G2J9X7_9ACTN|nr:hypothetical protein [Streptomyces dangxiongensis]AYN39110.1 hypothetical protein D9753_09525 [Streptomyces dangxiongensis]
MRLNQAATDGGGGSGDLVVHQDDLGRVGHEADLLFEDLKGQADIAAAGSGNGSVGSTMQAAAALKSHGFQMGSALETTVEVWTTQVKAVLQARAHISDHLDFTQKLHAEDGAEIGATLRGRDGSAVSVSQLNEYFK